MAVAAVLGQQHSRILGQGKSILMKGRGDVDKPNILLVLQVAVEGKEMNVLGQTWSGLRKNEAQG